MMKSIENRGITATDTLKNEVAGKTKSLKERIKTNAELFAKSNPEIKGHITPTGVYLFDDVKMNFILESFDNIKRHPDWFIRIEKKLKDHPGVFEMQSSNSSDALLMNIFCYPDFISENKFTENKMKFGWNPNFSYEKKKLEYLKKIGKDKEFHFSEIDLKIDNSIFEAKLTETDFGDKEIETVKRYDGFQCVFNEKLLSKTEDGLKYRNYQLIRYILAAFKDYLEFILLVDETRNDLIEDFENTKKSVKISEFQKKICYKTWQDLIRGCKAEKLRKYISERYF
ncbi:MAG: hypothetical protein LBS03_02920 [Bacteroidales bacterium]|nr:hypothetical protein [Bacteroidales bacterium]